MDAASLSTTRTSSNVIANRPLRLTVMMALHPHLIKPNHHLPRATQKSQRRFWRRAPCHARLCDRLNLRASPPTSHCAGGRRGASSAFAEPLTVRSLASAATLSTAPTRGLPWAPVGSVTLGDRPIIPVSSGYRLGGARPAQPPDHRGSRLRTCRSGRDCGECRRRCPGRRHFRIPWG